MLLKIAAVIFSCSLAGILFLSIFPVSRPDTGEDISVMQSLLYLLEFVIAGAVILAVVVGMIGSVIIFIKWIIAPEKESREPLIKSFHDTLSNGFSSVGNDGFAFNQRFPSGTADQIVSRHSQ
ncbi:MAG: hypothetical protein ACI4J5_03435 [Oscillospiraceae bacterium]